MPVQPLSEGLIASYVQQGLWGTAPLHEVIDGFAESRPEAPAVADQHERLTFGEFVQRTHALADFLIGLGLQPGDAVALQAPNRVALPLMHFACNRADLLFVPLSSAWRHREIGHLLKVARAKVVVLPQDDAFDFVGMVDDLRPDLPDLEHVGTLDGWGRGADFDFDQVSRREVTPVRVQRDANSGRFCMLTSGTTGLPKLSVWSDNNLRHFMAEFADRIELTATDVAAALCPANTGATGYVFGVLGPILAGASSVMLEHWSPSEALALLEAERATTAVAVPTQVLKMLQHPDLTRRDFTDLRVFTNAGAAMPPASARQMEQVFGCVGHVCYGASDGGVPTMTSVRDTPEQRGGSVGGVLPGAELRLLDPAGTQVPQGEVGEVCWRGPTKSYGYLNEQELTDAAFDDEGFYHSGDLGRLDADGYLHITGRSKDMIIRGGQNISPVEIENLVSEHPAVSEVSVVGLPDPVYGERICACIVSLPGETVTVSGLSEFLLERGVAKFKLPEQVVQLAELPKSAGGKISKVDLRASLLTTQP